MFQIEWPNFLKGSVDLTCSGSEITPFLNHVIQKKIQLENIYWESQQQIRLTVQLASFFQLTKLIRKYGLKMRIQRKTGLPFWMYQIRLKKFFYAGIVLFVLALFAMSSFVWQVDIKGTDRVPENVVRTILKQEGIYLGQVKYRLPEQETLKQRLLARIPDIVWIGLEIEGTRVIVTVVEKKQIEKLQEKLSAVGPVDLIAKKEALITDMQIEQGNPRVGIHDVVAKNDILVSGIYGDAETPEMGKVVGAKGKVLGEVWYEAEVQVPVIQQRKVFTGEREKVVYPFIGSWVIKMPYFKTTFRNFEIMDRAKPVYLGKWQLPFGIWEEEYMQMKSTKMKLTEQAAHTLGRQRARADLKQKLGEDGKILTEKVLHQRLENGKVYLKIHFDVVENIATPKPILQGE